MESGDKDTAAPNRESDEPYEVLVASGTTTSRFDTIVGHLEDIIISNEFQDIQQQFLDANYSFFEDTEENKFIYTDIHKSYMDILETFLDSALKERFQDFSMEEFLCEVRTRRDNLDGELFELLFTFSDFVSFKEMMLDHKMARDGDQEIQNLARSCIICTPGLPRQQNFNDNFSSDVCFWNDATQCDDIDLRNQAREIVDLSIAAAEDTIVKKLRNQEPSGEKSSSSIINTKRSLDTKKDDGFADAVDNSSSSLQKTKASHGALDGSNPGHEENMPKCQEISKCNMKSVDELAGDVAENLKMNGDRNILEVT